MKKKITVGKSLLLIFLAALITFQVTYFVMYAKNKKDMAELSAAMSKYNKLLEVQQLYENIYVGELDEELLQEGMIAGYVMATGDTYGMYYDAESFTTYRNNLMSGDMQGIGVHVAYNTEYGLIEIANVMPDSPALEAGVLPGDLIVYVGAGENKQNAAELDYYDTLGALQGKAGTTAEFTVARGKNYEELVEFSIMRAEVTEQTVIGHVCELDKSVGVVRITNFNGDSPAQFVEVVNTLTSSGCRKLIMDVRNNPGGERESVCAILDMLLPEGPVIRASDSSGEIKVLYTSNKEELALPMAVLVNENTASAGELFCSALQDYKKAVIVGVQTFGKGQMQQLQSLSDGSGLSLTVAYYYPPFSDNFDGIGVTPDVVAEPEGALLEKNLYLVSDGEDNQLRAALAELNR